MGFFTDWLDPGDGKVKGRNPDGTSARRSDPIHPDADARTKLDRYCEVPKARDEWCGVCGRVPKRCKCDAKLGRPKRWFE